jgi:hypothetical protein
MVILSNDTGISGAPDILGAIPFYTEQRGMMMRWLVVTGWLSATLAGPADGQAPDARAIVGRAVAAAGGEAALRGVERVAFKMMTQWQRTAFRAVPWTDRPSFEPHTDVRDYTIPAWRNTREFPNRPIVNVIRDSIALTDLGQGFRPLSVAYVDERAEVFVYTPDRLLVALLDAPDARAARDTSLGGERHHRVAATLAGRFPSTVFFHAGTGLPTLLRFRAGHPNDFGLVSWGTMSVDVWYSAWRSFDGIGLATQWDILRVGVPYKRMTVLRASFNPTFAADSFAVTPDQRAGYVTSNAVRPMHENVVIRSVSMPDPGLVVIDAFGVPAGAVRTGPGWLVLGAGHTPFNYAQALRLLDSAGAAPVTGVLVGAAMTGNGGLAAMERGLPVWVSPASEPFARMVLAGAGRASDGLRRVTPGTVLGAGADRVRLEPVDLPNVPGSMMLFRERTGWLYLPDAETDLDVAMGRARAASLGWNVRLVGTARALVPADSR